MLNRIAPIPVSGGIRIAFSTGDNSTDPEWQAEPVEAATSSGEPSPMTAMLLYATALV